MRAFVEELMTELRALIGAKAWTEPVRVDITARAKWRPKVEPVIAQWLCTITFENGLVVVVDESFGGGRAMRSDASRVDTRGAQ